MIREITDRHLGHMYSASNAPAWIESVDWDACVVGSGPGGAVAAATLAESGWRVLMIERGAFRPPSDMNFQLLDMAMRLGRLELTNGGRTTLHTGDVLGGGSIIFGAVAMRPPAFIFDEWAKSSGITSLEAMLAPHYDHVARVMSVTPQTPAQENRPNAIVREMAGALGRPDGLEAATRYTAGCRGTGLCPLGCGFNLKGTMANSFLPLALDTGNLTVLTECEALALDTTESGAGRRATILHAGSFRIRSRWYILAGGPLASTGILMRSGLHHARRQRSPRRVWLQPHGLIYALFDDPVTTRGPTGVPAIYNFTGLLRERRYYWFASSVYPASLATYTAHLPPDEHRRLMARFYYTSAVTITVRDAPSQSRIVLRNRAPQLEFQESRDDVEAVRQCFRDASRALLAVGARRVFLPMLQPPRIEREADVRELDRTLMSYDRLLLYSDHTSGGNSLGASPERGDTDAYGRVRGMENVHVADASLFPSACGVAPSWTIMALSRMVAANLVAAA